MDKETQEMKKIEVIIGQILRIGVVISVGIIAIGIILYLFSGTGGYANNAFPTSIYDIVIGVNQGKPYAFMMLGLLFLIFTPVLRVIVSIYAFAKERDTMYTVITTIVLIILIIAMIIGI
ncbi:membrane protein [Companilactobacillus sp. RD055328]|uniref:DUF1634 domain-containing protein n=1 Tax=Companilactobacillus sp. RD055328 TaxID=2916634 RepID=UPI001FC84EB0|nr:DUF1634 domain-containing protein [Companilactobacillus sp. RD055328]GKQ42450.1 membrane protein [Companilactobacillus sp. RD055328]